MWAFTLCLSVSAGACTKAPIAAPQPTPKLAPDVTIQTLSGDEISLRALRGKVVVLDFMASWCRPCEKALPHYVALQERYGADKLQVLLISQDADRDDISVFIDRLGVRLPVGIDEGERWYLAFSVTALPTAVVLDRSGRVRATVDGSGDERFTRRVDALVAELVATR